MTRPGIELRVYRSMNQYVSIFIKAQLQNLNFENVGARFLSSFAHVPGCIVTNESTGEYINLFNRLIIAQLQFIKKTCQVNTVEYKQEYIT